MGFLYQEKNGVPFFTPFTEKGVRSAVSTRQGGVSGAHLSSLNLGVTVGDRAENVQENQRRFAKAVGFSAENTVATRQEHTDVVLAVGESHRGTGFIKPRFSFGVDGLVTNTPNLPLFAYSADCPMVLFYDKVARAVGICHSGWRGTVKKIAAKTVEAMEEAFGACGADMEAAICPFIGPCCFLVDAPVYAEFCTAFGEQSAFFAGKAGEKYKIDLGAAIEETLKAAGVRKIYNASLCTACHTDIFYSHRKSGGKRGLFGGVIELLEGGEG